MKSVFITGATSGIGRALCVDYAANGKTVYACGRNQQVLNELKAEFDNIVPVRFDVTDKTSATSALSSFDLVPDVWILNAGDCEYIEQGVVDSQLVSRVFNTNVMGVVNTIEAFQHHLQNGQRIVIVGSIASELALPRAEAYGASKAAVSYFARALKQDLAPKGVEVSVVYPGFVKTPLTDKNTFDMPMMVSVEQASNAIRKGIEQGKSSIYFPKRFTSILRFIGALPYSWQYALTKKLLKN
ncbi:SDR family NAD(P)-dependent oxidoreductase [Vibrio sonorensis]|uniref:SDR family NAD(P)-dependent oxidoreductase n=1 Tax=Vibrio sonorensis TaxID=1004316 RepID=UPI0008DACB81|nr:SDR family NAD(P)-dependent oxidoreductase [Vibrio sonorensis]